MEKVLIYNPRNGSKVNDIFAKNTYSHEVNTIKKYDSQVAEYLLKKYQFLKKIQPKDLPETVKLIEAKFECNYEGCDYVTDTEKKLRAHIMGKHKITKEVEELMSKVEEAQPLSEIQEERKLTSEEMEGIPNTKKGDVDGWYGEGLVSEKIGSGMMVKKQPGVTPGHFK